MSTADTLGIARDPASAARVPGPRKTVKRPRVWNPRTWRTLLAALERAKASGDEQRVEHVRSILNGRRPVPGGKRA